MRAEQILIRGSITQQTLRLMQGLMNVWSKHPFFVQLSREIADLAGAKNPDSEGRAVWAWIRANVAYRADPVGTQWIQDPFETASKSKAGNCANMAVLAGTMLMALGHPATAIAVQWADRNSWTHAVVKDEKLNRIIDPVSPSYVWPPTGKRVSALMGAA